jgi:hypothetical protein
MAKVTLSGPVLVNILSTTLFASIYEESDIGVIAERVYEGIAQVIEHVNPGNHGDGTPVPDIMIADTIGPSAGE